MLKNMKKLLQNKMNLIHHRVPIMEMLESVIIKEIHLQIDLEQLREIR